MQDKLLLNQVIFLTGGSSGIGYECAKAYASAGANVALCCVDEAEAAEAARTLGPKHLGLGCDVSRADQVQRAIERILERYNKLDSVHNNAGIASPSSPVHETTDAEWNLLMDINLKSIYYTTRSAFKPLCDSKGVILNTSSLVGEIGQENHAAYSATKGALNALTKSMALDYAKFGIRVNAVCPAGVWTPMLRKWASEQPSPSQIEDYLAEIHPLGYCPDGNVIADACVFLLSEQAKFVTGHLMHVTGGAELGYRKI